MAEFDMGKAQESLVPKDDAQRSITFSRTDEVRDDATVFTKYSPLPRLLMLSIGPLLCQFMMFGFQFLDAFWAAKFAGGTDGLAVLGAIGIIEYISVAIGEYFMTGYSARASYLYGRGDNESAAQMLADFLRMAFVACGATVAVVLPSTKPLIRAFGGEGVFPDRCFSYMRVQACATVAKYCFLSMCGHAQSEGKSWRFAMLQFVALAVDQGANGVLFGVFRLPIWALPVSRAIGEVTATIVALLIVAISPGRVHLRCRMFVRWFSPDTWKAMASGLAAFVGMLSGDIPMIVLQRYLTQTAKAVAAYNEILSVWSISSRLFMLVAGSAIAFCCGAMPAAGFAFGRGDFRDLLATYGHCAWVATVGPLALSLVIIFFPRQVAGIWDQDPLFLEWARKLMPLCQYTSCFFGLANSTPMLVQSIQKPLVATVLSICTDLVPSPVVSSILHATVAKTDPVHLVWTFPICNSVSLLIGGSTAIYWVTRIRRGDVKGGGGPPPIESLMSSDAFVDPVAPVRPEPDAQGPDDERRTSEGPAS